MWREAGLNTKRLKLSQLSYFYYIPPSTQVWFEAVLKSTRGKNLPRLFLVSLKLLPDWKSSISQYLSVYFDLISNKWGIALLTNHSCFIWSAIELTSSSELPISDLNTVFMCIEWLNTWEVRFNGASRSFLTWHSTILKHLHRAIDNFYVFKKRSLEDGQA